MTTPVDIDAVLRAAEKATARPWEVDEDPYVNIRYAVTQSGESCLVPARVPRLENAEFIALACNSAVAMAEEIRGLRKENERVNGLNDTLYRQVIALHEIHGGKR